MGESSFFKAIEKRDFSAALEILDDVAKEATKKASDESKAAGLSVYDGRLKRWIGPDEPDPYAQLRRRRDDLRIRKMKGSENQG